MKKVILTSAFAAITSLGILSSVAFAGAVPCEDMLKDVRATLQGAKLGDADMKKVTDLEAKGIERCNADDDKRADGFFTDAMKIMGK
jgi:hypothetical protein